MEEEKVPQIENLGEISIPDFKEYEIDRKGNVFRNGKLIKQQTNTYGYEWEYAFDYFIELTKQLRHNQRRYFAQRRPEILATCKKLESEVDAIVAKITDKQMRLF